LRRAANRQTGAHVGRSTILTSMDKIRCDQKLRDLEKFVLMRISELTLHMGRGIVAAAMQVFYRACDAQLFEIAAF
jgi:hypothetical protein